MIQKNTRAQPSSEPRTREPDEDEATVYIVDDDPAIRDSTALLLNTCGFHVRTFASSEEFLVAAPDLVPGCLISDVRMPGLDGIGLVAKLKELKLHFPAIVITGHGDIRTAVNALKAGAEDFLEKPFTSEALLNVVQRLKQTIHSADLDAGTAAKRLSNLTGRERDVLHRLMAGMPNKIIAHDLTISIRTVEFYRTRVMKKLRVKSLSEMIRLALTAGVEIDLSKAQRPRF